MPRLTKIYTRKGDKGKTRLGSGETVSKDDLRVEAYGAVDELNAHLGAALAAIQTEKLKSILPEIQNELFHLGAELSMAPGAAGGAQTPAIAQRHVKALEKLVDEMTSALGPLENFILPGGTPGAAALHVARTVCRRAERRTVTLNSQQAVGTDVIPYLNRLSDALFVFARYENFKSGREETTWDPAT